MNSRYFIEKKKEKRNIMFENIGGKLKIIARLFTVLGIGVSLFSGIALTADALLKSEFS